MCIEIVNKILRRVFHRIWKKQINYGSSWYLLHILILDNLKYNEMNYWFLAAHWRSKLYNSNISKPPRKINCISQQWLYHSYPSSDVYHYISQQWCIPLTSITMPENSNLTFHDGYSNSEFTHFIWKTTAGMWTHF